MPTSNTALIRIGGFVPLTTIDYPEHLAAVIFCQGCPLHCYYCHNPDLRLIKQQPNIEFEAILRFLNSRINLLEAVVFSGGEPTIQKDILTAITQVKAYGFKIGLHTAGIYPHKLQPLLPYVDWIGFDAKAPFNNYQAITKINYNGKKVKQSISELLKSKVDYLVRTTVHPHLLSTQDILNLANDLYNLGVTNYCLQPYRISKEQTKLDTVTQVDFAPFLEERFINHMSQLFPNFSCLL